MKKVYLILSIYFFTCATISAQVEKIENYSTGTKITFYPNACGTELPEVQGKISFCDEANNLGVVEQSYGLNSDTVIKIVPNYFNNDEVFITSNGYSIHKSDGTWQNIPALSIPGENLSFHIISEDAIVTADGKLLFATSNGNLSGLTYLDLNTLMFDTIDYGSNDLPQAGKFAYDSNTGITYILAELSNQVNLYSLENNNILNLGVVSGLSTNSAYWNTAAIVNGFLYVGGEVLYKIDLNGNNLTVIYDNSSLPASNISKITADDSGNLWMAFSAVGGGLSRFNTSTEAFDFFELENQGNGNYSFQDVTVAPDGLIWALANSYDGIITLDPNDTEPLWTFIPTEDIEGLGFPLVQSPKSVDAFNGSLYFASGGVIGSSTEKPFEFLKLTGDVWRGYNDEAPGNISAKMALTNGSYTENMKASVAGKNGGVWWLNQTDDILTFLSDDDSFGITEFSGSDPILVLDESDRPNTLSGGLLRYNAPLVQKFDDDIVLGFDPEWLATYQDELWLFDRQTSVLHIYKEDNETAVYTLDNYDSHNPVTADSFGNAIYSEVNTSTNEVIVNRFNRTTETTETFSFEYSISLFPSGISNALQQITLPDGKMAFLSETTIFLFEGGTITDIVIEDLGFESYENIRAGTADEAGNLILMLNTPKLTRILDPFESLNVESYRFGVTSGSSAEQSILPEINFGLTNTVTVDHDGGIWTQANGEWLKVTLADANLPPANFESFRIKGQVYFDSNNNDALDADELYKNQRLAITKDDSSFIRYTVSKSNGEFEFLYQGEGDYTITILGSDPYVFTETSSVNFTVTDVNQDTDLGLFKLQTRYIDALLVKSAEKVGAWGFDRNGFENTFTTAIGNVSATKNFTNLNFQFLYQNKDENSDNIVPQIEEVKIYRVTSETGVPVIHNTSIEPFSNNWSINDHNDNYTINLLAVTPEISVNTDSVTIDFIIDQLDAKDMIIIAVETDLFEPEQNGAAIEFGLSLVGADNLDENDGPLQIPLIPRPSDNPNLRFPEDLPPFPDPNNPATDPFVPEGPVYAPLPKNTRIMSSYDPNDKMVSPGLPDILNEIDINTPYLTYTIRFENEGNFSAKDIYVLDELDPNLDLNSIQIIDASHEVIFDELSIDGNTTLRFFFKDIFLDYTTNDPNASQGYVKFAVRPLEGIALNTIVENTAAIYFDQNPPIITNTTQHQFVELLLSSHDFSIGNIHIKAFPNPVRDGLELVLPEIGDYTVQIYDLMGRIMRNVTIENKQSVQLDLSHLTKGNYILNVINSEATAQIKIIKH